MSERDRSHGRSFLLDPLYLIRNFLFINLHRMAWVKETGMKPETPIQHTDFSITISQLDISAADMSSSIFIQGTAEGDPHVKHSLLL